MIQPYEVDCLASGFDPRACFHAATASDVAGDSRVEDAHQLVFLTTEDALDDATCASLAFVHMTNFEEYSWCADSLSVATDRFLY